MPDLTPQIKEWSGNFGKEYTDRNSKTVEESDAVYAKMFGITRTSVVNESIGHLDRSIRILEVGTNIGIQLQTLQKLGFANLYGIELQWYAVEQSRKSSSNLNILQGSGFDIPFKDGYFDLVFTSGVLIHISPDDIGKIFDEIYRCSRKYIWGTEYYSEKYECIDYRGKDNLLWKTNFAKLYQDRFKNLLLAKERKIKYLESQNIDQIYLLEK